MHNITQIPAPRVPLIDERTGLMSREWFRYLSNIFYLTGNGSSSTTIPNANDNATVNPFLHMGA